MQQFVMQQKGKRKFNSLRLLHPTNVIAWEEQSTRTSIYGSC